MPANYSTNPTNPANQSGGQPFDPMTGQKDPSVYTPTTQPRSIRDYLQHARARTGAPTFTNIPGQPGYQMETPQAIPEAPADPYEQIPFSERLGIDPYIRAEMRVKSFLPYLWQTLFPGRPQGQLNEQELPQWRGAVEALTTKFLKRFEKQYEWDLKNKAKNAENRASDKRYWQSKFIDAQIQGNPITGPDGKPITEAEFVKQRMAVADEMTFKEEMAKQEQGGTEQMDGPGGFAFTQEQVMQVLQSNPGLGSAIDQQIRTFIEDGAGKKLSDEEYQYVLNNPNYERLVEESTQDALRYYKDKIEKALSGQVQ